MVVMKGFATTAGSRWHNFAKMGNIAPTSFATTTVQSNAKETTKDTVQVYPSIPSNIPSIYTSFKQHATASVTPSKKEVSSYFKITFPTSLVWISPRERARMTVTEACAPELPPVPIIMGTQATR